MEENGEVVSSHTNALSENVLGSAPCVQETCAHRHLCGSVDVFFVFVASCVACCFGQHMGTKSALMPIVAISNHVG